jgi:hypothetical protein
MWLFEQDAIAHGLWQGVFQLVALGIVAAFGTFIFQRLSAKYTLRDELIEAINDFSISLYKPRKVYQSIIDKTCDPLGVLPDPGQREARRLEMIYRSLEEIVLATGQFRALQVKIVALYGHDLEIFSYYMAIWRYLKEIRHRMGNSESLYFQTEGPESSDAFYVLIDAFRYRVMMQSFARTSPGLERPEKSVIDEMRRRGDLVYAKYFSDAQKKPEQGTAT